MNHFSQVEFRGFPILQGIEIAHDDDRRIGMLLLDPDSQMVDILKGMPSASGTAISCKTNGDLNPLYPLSCRVSCLFSFTFSLIGSDNKNSRPTSCRASITPLSLQDCEWHPQQVSTPKLAPCPPLSSWHVWRNQWHSSLRYDLNDLHDLPPKKNIGQLNSAWVTRKKSGSSSFQEPEFRHSLPRPFLLVKYYYS